MQQVVILGGGFAGIAAAHYLAKKKTSAYNLTLIDQNSFHLFTPSLYEVATSESPRKNIAIPFKEIFGNKVHLVKGLVTQIDPKTKHIVLHNKQIISFDYLLIALGSESAFYYIPGLQEHAVPFKSLRDALLIKQKMKSMCCLDGKCNKKVQVVIGGGGFAGTELAAELMTYRDRLAKQYGLDKDCLRLTIIQGSDRLLKELDPHASKLAEKRIKNNAVNFAFGGHISKVDQKTVFTDNNKSYPYDILIWTGGVRANHFAKDNNLPVTSHGSIMINQFLQVEGIQNIFAAGDIAYFPTNENHPAPQVAQVAEEQGKIAGENIFRLINNQTLVSYPYRHWGYIVPLKGHFAVAELMGIFHFDGFWGWVLEQLVFLRYLLGILPLSKALKKWNTFEEELID